MAWFSKWRKRPADTRRDRGGERPIVLAQEPTDEEIRAAVAKWIEQMARGEYTKAVAAVFRDPPMPEEFRERVETFCLRLTAARQGVVDSLRQQGFNVSDPPTPETFGRAQVIPASAELLAAMEIHRDGIPPDAVAWLGFHLPLDNGFGIWTTMGVLRASDRCVLEFEILHL